MNIPFTKAHGAGNDFLLTWASDVPGADLPALARAICSRHTGMGADGWMLVKCAAAGAGYEASIRLFNADGSEPEMSGNGTRCAAAFLLDGDLVGNGPMRIMTGAGLKQLRMTHRAGRRFEFEMNMGRPTYVEKDLSLQLVLARGPREVSALSVGNPQCVVMVDDFDFDWRQMGEEIESHPYFPNHTNVSFVKPLDAHAIDVRFFERGVGETMSSGTGSTGAAAAAILRGVAESPVEVRTPAGPIQLRWENDIYLTGPAVLSASGTYYYEGD